MKQIIAILRDERVEATKEALDTIGVRGVTFLYVTGRGQKRGKVNAWVLGQSLNRNLQIQLANDRNGKEADGAVLAGPCFTRTPNSH